MKIRGMRFIVLIVTTLCLTSILSNMNTYNFTKICLNNATDDSATYTTFEKTAIQSSTAIGSLAASIPIVITLQKLPTKWVFLFVGFLSAAVTALIPLAEAHGFGWFLTARIIQGISFCVTFPMSGVLTSNWAPLGEHGIFLSMLTGFSQLANIFTMPVSGALCSSSLGWRSVYYVHAGVGVVIFILCFLIFEDTPRNHPLVGEVELEWIMKGREKGPQGRQPVPYKSILKSPTIWGVWFSGFADILAIQFINMYNPQYLNDYLNYDVMNTGFLAAVPVIVQWICKIFAGFSSDAMTCISENIKIRAYNSLALMLSALFFILLSFMPKTQPVLCLTILIITEGLIGFNTAGFNKCGTLHSRQHAHFVMMQIMNIQSITILAEPFIVNAILTDNTASQWRIVFLVHAVLLIAANAFYFIFADARPAKWTEETIEEKQNGKIVVPSQVTTINIEASFDKKL